MAKILYSSVEFLYGYNDIIISETGKIRFTSLELAHNYYDIKIFGYAKVFSASIEFEKRPEITDYIINMK